jgi:hypothetical protein
MSRVPHLPAERVSDRVFPSINSGSQRGDSASVAGRSTEDPRIDDNPLGRLGFCIGRPSVCLTMPPWPPKTRAPEAR